MYIKIKMVYLVVAFTGGEMEKLLITIFIGESTQLPKQLRHRRKRRLTLLPRSRSSSKTRMTFEDVMIEVPVSQSKMSLGPAFEDFPPESLKPFHPYSETPFPLASIEPNWKKYHRDLPNRLWPEAKPEYDRWITRVAEAKGSL